MLEHWQSAVAPGWADALGLADDAWTGPSRFLEEERAHGHDFAPASEHVLRDFETPLSEVRVLIVGQDPYPTPGDAVGLSFSVPAGRRLPPSLRNIARELREDTGEELASGDLTPWQSQGVMLLNRVLTVRPGEAGSHRRRGWETVTDLAVRALAARGGPLVAVLWGRDAQALGPLLDGTARIESAHPSPLSARTGFFGSRPFSRVNAALEAQGAPGIVWATPAG